MVLLVIDTQKLITTNALYQFETFVSHEKELIKKAREKGIEVVYVRHDDGPDEELTKGKEGGTELLEYLQEKVEKEIIITGLQTDYCIDATVKCGFEHGFHVIIPATTNTTVDNVFMTAEQSYRYHNEFMWPRRYAECIPYEEMLERIEMYNK